MIEHQLAFRIVLIMRDRLRPLGPAWVLSRGRRGSFVVTQRRAGGAHRRLVERRPV